MDDLDKSSITDETNRKDQEQRHSARSSNPEPLLNDNDNNKGNDSTQAKVDGGLICWLQVAGVFAAWTNSWGLVNAFGEFQAYYASHLPQSQSQIAWVGSLQAFLVQFSSIWAGRLFDAGYFRYLLYIGNFLIVFGMMMTSLCKEYWQIILAQGILQGLGMGCIFIPSVAIIPQYFVKKRQWASGAAAVGSGVGGVIYPIVLRRLTVSIGFPWAVRVVGFLTLFFAFVSATTLRNRLPAGGMRDWIPPNFFRDAPSLLYTGGLFCAVLVVYIPVFYISDYSIDRRLTNENLAFYMVPIVQASNIGGRLLAFVADWIGPISMTIPALMGVSVLAFAWIAVKSAGGLITWAVIYGICFGIVQGLAPGCVISINDDPKTLGSRMGTCFGIAAFGVLIGSPVAGAILGSGKNYTGVQCFTGGVAAAALIIYMTCRYTRVGFRLRGKI